MELNPNIIRQGDTISVYVENPETAPVVVEPGQSVILMFGEMTGHSHQLISDAPIKHAPTKPVFDATAERYLQLLDTGKLSHEEHTVALFKPGVIELGVQVEAGPDNMIRQVQD